MMIPITSERIKLQYN